MLACRVKILTRGDVLPLPHVPFVSDLNTQPPNQTMEPSLLTSLVGTPRCGVRMGGVFRLRIAQRFKTLGYSQALLALTVLYMKKP